MLITESPGKQVFFYTMHPPYSLHCHFAFYNINLCFCLEINTTMTNKGVGYICWIILSEQPNCSVILPKFISMAIRK
jgi:hypothetical protein